MRGVKGARATGQGRWPAAREERRPRGRLAQVPTDRDGQSARPTGPWVETHVYVRSVAPPRRGQPRRPVAERPTMVDADVSPRASGSGDVVHQSPFSETQK